MNWIPKVSLVNLDDLAGAVNKFSESVKSIEKNFDNALGFQDANLGTRDGKSESKSSETGAFQPPTEPSTDSNSNYFSDPISSNVSALASSLPSFLSMKSSSALDPTSVQSNAKGEPQTSTPDKFPIETSSTLQASSTVSPVIPSDEIDDPSAKVKPLSVTSTETATFSASDHIKSEYGDAGKENSNEESFIPVTLHSGLLNDSTQDAISTSLNVSSIITSKSLPTLETENLELTNQLNQETAKIDQESNSFNSLSSDNPSLLTPSPFKNKVQELPTEKESNNQIEHIFKTETLANQNTVVERINFNPNHEKNENISSIECNANPTDPLHPSPSLIASNSFVIDPTQNNSPELRKKQEGSPVTSTLLHDSPLSTRSVSKLPVDTTPTGKSIVAVQKPVDTVSIENPIDVIPIETPVDAFPSEKTIESPLVTVPVDSISSTELPHSIKSTEPYILNDPNQVNSNQSNQSNTPEKEKKDDKLHPEEALPESIASDTSREIAPTILSDHSHTNSLNDVHPSILSIPPNNFQNNPTKTVITVNDSSSSSTLPPQISEKTPSINMTAQNETTEGKEEEVNGEKNDKDEIEVNGVKNADNEKKDNDIKEVNGYPLQTSTSLQTEPETEPANLVLPDSSDLTSLVSDSKMLEVALRAAAKQSQVKADELARYMAMNDELKSQIDELKKQVKKNNETELNALREEYTHRLSATERRVYALTKERDMLKREQNRKSDVSSLLKEKDEIIKQVMAEGEELSKKQATQEASIKKLRSQIRELEEEKQRLSSRVSAEESKVESIKKDKLATEKALQEIVEKNAAEMANLKENYARLLSAAEERLLLAEAKADSTAKADLDRKLREANERENTLVLTVDELRQSLTRIEQQNAFREERLKRDIEDLEERCQNAELRCEDLIARMPDSTRPLLRQIEAIQESSKMRMEALSGVERALNARLQESEAKAAMATEKERVSSERLSQTLSRLAVLEAQLGCLKTEQNQLSKSLEKERSRASELRQQSLSSAELAATHEDRSKQLENEFKEFKTKSKQEYEEEKRKKESIEQELQVLRASLKEHERIVKAKEGRYNLNSQNMQSMMDKDDASRRVSSSSFESMDDSHSLISSKSYSQSQPFAAASYAHNNANEVNQSTNKSQTNLSRNFPTSRDQLESMLRQKEGEVSSLMTRLAAIESTRDSLAEELVNTTTQLEMVKNDVSLIPGLRAELAAIRRRHSSALELMGERDEQVEELKADLQDVKQMYREQIDLLVNKIEKLSLSITP